MNIYITNKVGKLAGLICLLLMTVPSGFGELLVTWSTEGLNGGFAANSVWNTDFAHGGMVSNQTVATLDGSDWSAAAAGMTGSPQNNPALSSGRYMKIIITPEDGQSVTLTNMMMNIYSETATDRGYEGSVKVALRSSIDNFSSNIGGADYITLTRGEDNSVSWELGANFNRLESSIEFRVYLWGATTWGLAYPKDVSGNNAISVYGTTAPEYTIASWSTDGLSGGFVDNPVWNSDFVHDGVASNQTFASLDGSDWSAAAKKMTGAPQNNPALSASRYMKMVMTPLGQKITFSSILMNIYSQTNTVDGSDGAVKIALRSSVDNFSNNIGGENYITLTRGQNNKVTWILDSSFSEIESPIEFRVYLWGAVSWGIAYPLDSGTDAISVYGITSPGSFSSYADWANQWGGTNIIGSEVADYDGDGVNNLYEYGLGGDPTDELVQGTSPQFDILALDGTNVCNYVYPQRSGYPNGLAYSLAVSTNLLGNWETNAGYQVTGTNVTGGVLDFVTNTLDTVNKQKFIRLIIE
ncbi:hypothetical protein [Tichowtungia aerotolerans]|uniref:Uncharacterized protein n=1 Tax=Tichowtungia aerotolerans TaxID=2697043 RepID=A0A6P1MBB2_9BACT|nr:hypothetical protein [Tichowtungia aerotolerans]QHI70393.1 hypothetical protein GT409_13390 [Tichowtungia aerotolerans]